MDSVVSQKSKGQIQKENKLKGGIEVLLKKTGGELNTLLQGFHVPPTYSFTESIRSSRVILNTQTQPSDFIELLKEAHATFYKDKDNMMTQRVGSYVRIELTKKKPTRES